MATAPQIDDTTTLSGQPTVTQPGAQLPYGPGASSSPSNMMTAAAQPSQVGALPGSVMTAGPVTTPEAQQVKNTLDQFALPPMTDPNKLVQDSLSSFEDAGSRYMTNAQRRGLELAASRGLGNSSIAAGASQRAALEAVTPFVNKAVDVSQQREQNQFTSQQNQLQQALDIAKQREQNAFTGGQNTQAQMADLTRQREALEAQLRQQREGYAFQGEQSALDREQRAKLQQDATYQQDWLQDRNFTREFNASLSQLPVQNAFQMQQLIAQYALENPEVYTPQVTAGLTNFFQNNMMSILKQYFPNMVQGG